MQIILSKKIKFSLYIIKNTRLRHDNNGRVRDRSACTGNIYIFKVPKTFSGSKYIFRCCKIKLEYKF